MIILRLKQERYKIIPVENQQDTAKAFLLLALNLPIKSPNNKLLRAQIY